MAVGDIETAIKEFNEKLPGWWFTIGECSVSCDATVGPDRAYCDQDILNRFDDGVDWDLAQPSTLAQALREATYEALRLLEEGGFSPRTVQKKDFLSRLDKGE